MKPDQSDTLLPAKRILMGLIEYMMKFFTARNMKEVDIYHYYCAMFNVCYRLNAQQTITLGFRPCTYFLEPNGSKYSMDLYGVNVL